MQTGKKYRNAAKKPERRVCENEPIPAADTDREKARRLIARREDA
jgi:hypothetical protein